MFTLFTGRCYILRAGSAVLLFGVLAGCGIGGGTPIVGVIERVSVATDGSEGSLLSLEPIMSSDGRFVAFRSGSDNLVSSDTNGVDDVFLRDTCRGAAQCTPSTIRVSVANDGSQLPAWSLAPSISADGRFVAFSTSADNVTVGDTNGFSDIFVRDTCVGATGCTPSTILISMADDGAQGNSHVGWYASISDDGRLVAFTAFSDNLVVGDTNVRGDIFVRDTCFGATGCTPSTIRVSVADDGGELDSGSTYATITADGRFVSFSTWADGVTADDTDGVPGIFQRDTCVGASGCTPSTTLIGPSSKEDNVIYFFRPEMSADGRYVVFMSDYASIVAGDTNNATDVFVRDTCRGIALCIPETVRISINSSGVEGDAGSGGPSISADGRFIAFDSFASNLVLEDTNDSVDVFVRDTCLGVVGCSPRTFRVSIDGKGAEGGRWSWRPSLSGDGRFVALRSEASNFVLDDGNSVSDIFVAGTGN